MATRSTVKFYEGNEEKPILSIYHHWDGYITGVGHDLANWLKDKKTDQWNIRSNYGAGLCKWYGMSSCAVCRTT